MLFKTVPNDVALCPICKGTLIYRIMEDTEDGIEIEYACAQDENHISDEPETAKGLSDLCDAQADKIIEWLEKGDTISIPKVEKSSIQKGLDIFASAWGGYEMESETDKIFVSPNISMRDCGAEFYNIRARLILALTLDNIEELQSLGWKYDQKYDCWSKLV